MKQIVLLIFISCFQICNAQYYYNDILANKITLQLNEKIKANKVEKIVVKSYEFDDTEVEDFLCEQYIENSGKHCFTITGSPYVGENHLHSYFNNINQISRSIDSSASMIVQNYYEYTNNNLTKISVTSFEKNTKDKDLELHNWYYDNKGVANKMYLIKNGNDTTTIIIKKDSILQLPTEEIIKYKNVEKEHYYYYYDANNRLTDVVRFHPYKKKLLPEYIFEYNTKNEISRKTVFLTGTNDYKIWFYEYNDAGLKTSEMCYLKGNKFRGKMKYIYSFERN